VTIYGLIAVLNKQRGLGVRDTGWKSDYTAHVLEEFAVNNAATARTKNKAKLRNFFLYYKHKFHPNQRVERYTIMTNINIIM
jgi:hypothetical protein